MQRILRRCHYDGEVSVKTIVMSRFARHSASLHPGIVGRCTLSHASFEMSKSALVSPLAREVSRPGHLPNLWHRRINASFDVFCVDASGHLEKRKVRSVTDRIKRRRGCTSGVDELSERWAIALTGQWDPVKDSQESKSVKHAKTIDTSQQRDPRMWPYAGSMAMIGVAAGVAMPALPSLAFELGVTQAQFGYVTAGFGLARLISNLPSGMCADLHGRQTTLIGGCLLCGVGFLALGFATSLEHMVIARFVMGGGSAFTMAGATLAVADVSTESNRAQMMGPVITAFSAGAAIGPVIGSGLIDSVGFQNCSLIISAMLLGNALVTRSLTSETMLQMSTSHQRKALANGVRETMAQWGPLCKDEPLRSILLVNAAYRVALAGGMLTVLPLMLTNQFACGASEIGMVFAMQSMVSVVGTEPVTRLADHVGAARLLAPGLALMAMSFSALPLAADVWQAIPSLMAMALSNTVLLTAPTAAVANIASASDRAQALALLRTAGDAGLLVGGIFIGTASGFLGFNLGLQGTSAFLMASAAWFATRRLRF